MKKLLSVLIVLYVFILVSCSQRYTKQFVADESDEQQEFLLHEQGWNLFVPSLSAFKDVKDIGVIADTNKYWLTIHSYYPLEKAEATKRDFKIDSVKFIFHTVDSAKYETLLESHDKELLSKIFNLAYLKKKDYSQNIGYYFDKYPYVKNKILTKIDSLQIPADTIWTQPSRKVPFMDTDKENFHVAYNFFDTNFVRIFDDVLKVELIFDYEIIDDVGNSVKSNTLSCIMYRDDSAKDMLFFLE